MKLGLMCSFYHEERICGRNGILLLNKNYQFYKRCSRNLMNAGIASVNIIPEPFQCISALTDMQLVIATNYYSYLSKYFVDE